MAIKTDTFTGAAGALSAHTSDFGSGWGSGSDDVADFALDGSGLVSSSNGGAVGAFGTESPASADYYNEIVGQTVGNTATDRLGTLIRGDGLSFGSATVRGYIGWVGGDGNWVFGKYITDVLPNTSFTQLNTGAVAGWVVTTSETVDQTVRVTANGSTISMSVNGTQVASVTDTDLTAAGNAGIYFRGSNATITSLDMTAVTAANQAPVVVAPGIPDQSHAVGAVVSLNISAHFSDPDADTLAFTHTAGTLPSGITFDGTATFSGTIAVGADTSSPYNGLIVQADDGNGGTVQDTFIWTVAATNSAPTVVAPGIPDRTGQESAGNLIAPFSIVPFFTDSDGDTLTYTANTTPPGITLDSASGAFSGTPTASGTTTITVTANDGIATVNDTFDWTIAAPAVSFLAADAGDHSFVDENNVQIASVAGLSWAIFSGQGASALAAPIGQGTNGSISASGEMTLTLASSAAIASGSLVTVLIHNADWSLKGMFRESIN